VAEVHFVDEEHLELSWPAHAFAIGEQVRLSLSLDGGIVYQTAPRALTVYGGIQLQRARPLRLYRWQAGENAQLLYAETGTSLVNTQAHGLMRCRFGRAAHTD
jgi:hypothetical protein